MRRLLLFSAIIADALCMQAQNIGDALSSGTVHGNFEVDAQYYNKDTLIGAQDVPENMLMNGWMNLIYTNQNFEAGVRYESYDNPLLGFPTQYKGSGIPYRYLRYHNDEIDVTAGSFYEQFGSGLIFRTYESRQLGYDNAMDGFRVKYQPYQGISLKGVIGHQRYYFSEGPGIVRGADGEVDINELFPAKKGKKRHTTDLILGGSFVSKYQPDQNSQLKLPENVGAWAERANLTGTHFNLYGEYAYKINDPSSDNNFIYKPGNATLIRASYFKKGLGISLSGERIDNMSFRSDRNASINDLLINDVPDITQQQTYNLLATLYPFATQLNGESGFQGQINYRFKRNSAIGGKYGTKILANLSTVYALDTTNLNDMNSSRMGYKSNYFGVGKQNYFQSIDVAVNKKFNRWFHAILVYDNLYYDKKVIQGEYNSDNIKANVGIADLTFKLSRYQSIRTELQALFTKQDQGDWTTVQIEYTIAPHWSFGAVDEYNYGNSDAAKRIHYYYGTIGYVKGANRISIGYGRQKAGIFCVGGVCRNVPASDGLTLTMTSSF